MASSRRSSRRTTSSYVSDQSDVEPFPNLPSPFSGAADPSPYQQPAYPATTATATTMNPSRPRAVTSSPAMVTTSQAATPPNVTVSNSDATAVPLPRPLAAVPTQIRRRPIGIKRLSSMTLRPPETIEEGTVSNDVSESPSTRRRSNSAPQRSGLPVPGQEGLSPQNRHSTLTTVAEYPGRHLSVRDQPEVQRTSSVQRRSSLSNAAHSFVSKFSSDDGEATPDDEYGSDVVDLLDVIDPEVQTLTTLTNVQNSLFVPDLGRWVNRRPTYELSRRPSRISEKETPVITRTPTQVPPPPAPAEEAPPPEEEPLTTPAMRRTWSWQRVPSLRRTHSISSVMTESHYAVLPHGVNLEGWSEEDKEALDDHVRHMLHSKRSKFKQRMKAFGKYVSRPLGFFVTLYATLITLFGLAWVLFLIGWIYVGDRQSYLINVIDNVLVALFAVVGDGLAPFRVVDTYHMCFIAHYHHLSWRLRREQGLPKLHDRNDLPERTEKEADPEAGNTEESEFSVLTPQQQKKLIHHQNKFSKSHSFYKPHETVTHYAFPLRLLVAIVVLLDCHSMFQIALGACTWGINYHHRPQALTATILSCSITVNITAGVLISVGDRKTRKKDVALKIERQELTQSAMKKVQKHKEDRETGLSRAANAENFEAIKEEEPQPVKWKLNDEFQSDGI